MWMKYLIEAYSSPIPIGLKFNFKTNEVILGASEKRYERMMELLNEYFDIQELEPTKSSTCKIKFVFEMKPQTVINIIRKMRENKNLRIEKVSSLERIYR